MERRQNCRRRFVWLVIDISALLSVVSVSSAVEYIWTQKADMPTPRWTQTSAVVNGKIYIVGGASSESDFDVLSTVEEYDPISDTWTRKADMPMTICDFDAPSSVVDGKIYVIGVGGRDEMDWSLLTVQEYDPSTDTWARKGDMPTQRWMFATVDFEGKVYVIGGYPPGAWVGLKTVELYDPVTDTWTRKADMPLGVALLNVRVVNGKIYAVGGRPDLKSRAYMQEYDPATDTWRRKADMPVATSAMGSVVLGDKIVVIGGWLWSVNYPYRTIQMYDPEADKWTIEGEAPFLRANFSAEVVNNRVYVIGGTDRPHPCIATSTVYELTINAPPPDFSADGSVGIKDLLTLIESWGQDDSVADIAPALGDGIVDVLDLEFLMTYWGQEIDDPTLVAHWALDETEGMIAYDSAGYCDGIVIGVPAWQPEAGKRDGALKLDGATFLAADHVLDPSDGPFSVLAWMQGGEPGQVVISQEGGVSWLMADVVDGVLRTELKSPARLAKSMTSTAVITDGDWHRVGFVWDGTNRRLYVDNVLVAEDTQKSLAASNGSLQIGCGMSAAATTFWTGLIDDVRIYNRAVKP